MMNQGICECCKRLAGAIERYITKAESGLSEELAKAGYADAVNSVKGAGMLEDDLAGILLEQTERIVEFLKKFATLEAAKEALESFFDDDDARDAVRKICEEYYSGIVPKLADIYIRETDGELAVSQIRKKTSSWITEWSAKLSNLMRLSSEQQIGRLIDASIEKGEGVDVLARRLMDHGIRNEQWQARRAALTEMLRAHSVAQQEAMTQDPSVTKKRWRHTGSYRNKNFRENHRNMDGQTVPVDKAYELQGTKGKIYHPMYPRDSILPPEESVNCHCLSQPIADDDILGMSLEEREKLQQQIIDEDDRKWVEELDARNKAKAGINEDTVRLDWIRAKDRESQIAYFGGGSAGRQRLALVESGVISSDEDLEKLYKVNGKGKRVRKTLQELADDGIFTVDEKALNHSVNGSFAEASKAYPNGRMTGGGHSQSAMECCDARGIGYEVNKTFSNGVRIGNVPTSRLKIKQRENGQAWFPETWDEDKILNAGTAVANNGEPLLEGYHKTGVYDGVAVRVLADNGKIVTICPDLDQDLYVEGVE